MPAEHDRGRIARRKETFRPVQNRVHIPRRTAAVRARSDAPRTRRHATRGNAAIRRRHAATRADTRLYRRNSKRTCRHSFPHAAALESAPSPPTSPRRTPEPSRKAAYMRAQPAPANRHRRTAAPRIHETRAAHNPRHCPCRTPFRWPTHPTESIMLRCGQPADQESSSQSQALCNVPCVD